MSLAVLSLLAVAAKLLVGVSAQAGTNATCLPAFSWMLNSKGQNPCLVAAYLQAACNNGNWHVVALPNGSHYTGPQQDETNACQCSTVTFSLISACGLCQNRKVERWSDWSFNCTAIFPQEFTLNIPANTAVPAWAYLDVQPLDQIDLTAAQADTYAPESTGTAAATGTAITTPSGAPFPTGSSKSSNAGAIAGEVVGGVVGLGLIAGAIIIYFARRRRSQRAHGNAHVSPFSPPPLSPPMSQHYGYPTAGATPAPRRLYDPGDPSTFPSSPPPVTIHTTSSGSAAHNQPRQIGHYNFVPEV